MKPGAKNKATPGLFKQDQFVTVCKTLNEAHARYLVIGGYACSLHGLIRATKDIDFLIPKDKENTEKVLQALKEGLAFGVAGELDAEEVAKKPFTIIGDTPRVDLLTVANTVKYEQAEKTALEVRIDKIKIPYIDLDTLLKTKKTGRLQDQADVEKLQQLNARRKIDNDD